MSLPPAQMLAALGMAQMTTVTPALEGRYEGGSAGTIGLLLILLAQDAATAVAREAAEVAAMRDLLNRTDGTHAELLTALADAHATADFVLDRRILDILVTIADSAFVAPPVAE